MSSSTAFQFFIFWISKDLIVLPLEALPMWLLVLHMCQYGFLLTQYVAERRESVSTLSLLAYDSLNC